MNLCPFDSVGLIVKNSEGKVLVLERKKIPLGLAFPAGHLDIMNGQKEDFIIAAKRELLEETGLVALKLRIILKQTFNNPCSKGYDTHYWQIFEVLKYTGEAKLMEPDKHARVWWASIEEIQNWIKSGRSIDPAWLKFIFPEINFFSEPHP